MHSFDPTPLTPEQEAETIIASILRRIATAHFRGESFLDSLTALPENDPETREMLTRKNVQNTLYNLKQLQLLILNRYPTADKTPDLPPAYLEAEIFS